MILGVLDAQQYLLACCAPGNRRMRDLRHVADAARDTPSSSRPAAAERADPMRDCILLCACGEAELLPQNPDLPADTFTSCLTTPIKVPGLEVD